MNHSLRLIYNAAYFERLCPVLENCIPAFDSRHFIFRVFDTRWPDMTLAERVTHIAKVLHDFLPRDCNQAATCINAVAAYLEGLENDGAGIECAFLDKYLELHGTGHVSASSHQYRLHAKAESRF